MRQRSFRASFGLAVLLLVFLGTAFRAGVLSAASVSELEQDIAAKEAEIKKLQEEAAAYRKTLNQATLQSKTLKGEIARIDAAIRETTYQLSIAKKELDATLLRLGVVNSKIADTETAMDRRKIQLTETLREIALRDELGFAAMVLAAPTIADFFRDAVSLANLETEMQEELGALKVLRQDLETNKNREEELKGEQNALRDRLAAQQTISQNQRTGRSTLLAKTQNQEKKFQTLLSENQKQQQAILRDIEDLESELRKLILRVTVPPRTPGLFAWPVRNGYVTQEYGDTAKTGFTNDYYSFHNGTDIGAAGGTGTPIRAVMAGTVTATGNLSPYAYGRWIAIDHGNGLTTLYAHLSYIGVKQGQKVGQGTEIGYMGATGYVTGPHLHLTVYATETFKVTKRSYGLLPLGASINPRDYLPRD